MTETNSLRRYRRAAVLASAVLLGATAASANAKVFIFGDSYSDNGNIEAVTAGAQPGPQYWAGRFTNGWTLAERLAFRLTKASPGRAPGLAAVQYSGCACVIGGVDFAHGGATAVTRGNLPKHLSIYNQAAFFRTESADKRIAVSKSDTAVVWAGINDYLAYGFTSSNTITNVITNQIVGTVALGGVGNILVLNLPNMGDLPGWIDGPKRAQLNAVTATHNAELATKLAARQPSTPTRLILVDVNKAMALAHKGLAGGFTVTRPGQGGSASGNCLGDGKVLWNCPSTYLYYDYVHLNWSGHEYLASITHDRLNSVLAQAKQAALSVSGASAVSASQSQTVSARLAAAQDGYSGLMSFGALGANAGQSAGVSLNFGASVEQSASLGGKLSLYSYGDSAAIQDETVDGSDRRFGFGADWSEGQWIVGAAAFQSSPGMRDRDETSEFSMRQTLEGVSTYAAWVIPEASVSLAATHVAGEQETERLTVVSGLPRATGRTGVSSSTIALTAAARTDIGGFEIKGDAALVYEDTLVSGFQETGTLGLSDTVYDDVVAHGVTGRVGAAIAYSDETAELAVGAHYLTRLSGTGSLATALPVAIPGRSTTQFDTNTVDPLAYADQATAVWASAAWKWSEQGTLNVGAAAVATPDGEVSGGLSIGANYKF